MLTVFKNMIYPLFYVIFFRGGNGDLEIQTKFQDFKQPFGAAGSPLNPIIIKRERW
jgi:hypothetical protein